jgi:HK97 family phage major capsid protein
MSEDIRDAVQGLGEAFEEFKKANDEKLDALEAGKSADPLQEEKIANIEAKLDSLEEINQKVTKAELSQDNIKEQLEQLETVMKRPNSGFDTKQIDESCEAFTKFVRKGKENLEHRWVSCPT